MIKALLLFTLVSCGPRQIFKEGHLVPSQSPCIDGTVLNIDHAGCESFYWGTINEETVLKIRCTYAPEDSIWTRSTFYAIPVSIDLSHDNWNLYCEDGYVKMYIIRTGVPLDGDLDESG
jgi:hypothetical protein